MNILIVDDDKGIAKVLTALCTSAGHQVVGTLADGAALEERLRELRPDLVCLDYQLPGRDGLALLQAVHAVSPAIDVVFMTGSQEADIEQRAADAGASGFVRKPFSQAQIVAELAAIAEARARAAAADDEGPAADLPPPAADAAAVAPTPVEAAAVDRGTVVVADDSAAVRLMLKGLLDNCGLRVLKTVGNGAEAIQAVRSLRPGIVCLDVNMPVMGGLEALPLIRELSPETAVVMVTGCADRAFVAKAAKLGARGYILKPLRPAYIEGFMRRLRA
ncbi:response regulator [Azospira restricta]|uniref:Response regulator n=1 Tax=Azospira restricta TaxID=404405 RepID=A0A974PY11_9RHOO|nr:response regulator [Azospira restricta]QRJ63552.1 response regulator [Azospira restricta]